MKLLVVDDEKLAVESLVQVIQKVLPESEIATFLRPMDAFDYLSVHPVDIAFLDIEMGELSGIALAKKCKDCCPTVNIIFATGYSQYTMDALRLHASGYLMKPVREDDLIVELENLRHPPISLSSRRVRIQAFGDFEIFVDGRPLKFPRSKCKECLAYLTDRKGAGVTYAQLSSVLWESQPAGGNVRNSTNKVVSDLMKTLREAGAAEIVFRSRLEIAIDTSKVDCDYYSAIQGDIAWMNTFTGEYMSNYSWAEFTLGELIKIQRSNMKL